MAKIVQKGGKIHIGIGSYASLTKSFTQQEILKYSELSGDSNPIHFSKEAAKEKGFEDVVVFGMLSSSLFSGLLGNNFPHSVYLSQTLNFLAPVYVFENLLAKVLVTDIQHSKSGKIKCFLDTTLTKSSLEVLAVEGKALILLEPNSVQLNS